MIKHSNDNFIHEAQNLLFQLEQTEKACTSSYEMGIISAVGMAENIAMIREQKFEVTKKLVDSVHVKSNGELLSIWEHEPTKSYPNGYWQTKTKGGKLLKAKDIESLYSKLYAYYYGDSYTTCTIGKVFVLALDEKKRCENPSEETVRRYKNDFNNYISAELADKDIVQVKDNDLKAYTQQLVTRIKMTRHSYLAFKGLLNLIFNYAMMHEIIARNPVGSINNSVYLKSCDTRKKTAKESTFSEQEIDSILSELERRESLPRYEDCFGYAFAIRFSILTGARVGEISALQWRDIDWMDETIHIHTQQVMRHDEDGHVIYIRVNHTKNERGISHGGRQFPLTEDLKDLLREAKAKQEELNISSDYIFTHANGEWLDKSEYTKYVRNLCKKLNLTVTRNHGFRKTLNSYTLVPNGISLTDRAKLMGHSPKVNLENYSFEDKDYVSKACEILNSQRKGTIYAEKGTVNPIPFTKRKSPQTLSL